MTLRCRYERTVRELGNLLNLELEPLQREIIEAPLDPDVRPKDAWDPHCDRLDKKLQARVKALHEQIDDIPNQIAEVEAQGVAECEKQKAAYEKVVAQMKTKLIRKEEMFNALTKQLDEVCHSECRSQSVLPLTFVFRLARFAQDGV